MEFLKKSTYEMNTQNELNSLKQKIEKLEREREDDILAILTLLRKGDGNKCSIN
ncbi:hypothetical protein [Alteribacillus sp. HJP-4]|uniref:hypothetical protein n=1 Tax=Alteribacillus sp. HJP-4 TaxID=2775394 RepID=UPI0035CD1E52